MARKDILVTRVTITPWTLLIGPWASEGRNLVCLCLHLHDLNFTLVRGSQSGSIQSQPFFPRTCSSLK